MTRSLHDPKAGMLSGQGLVTEDGSLLSDSTSSQMSVSNYHLAGGCGKEQNSDTTSDTASATSASGKYCHTIAIVIEKKSQHYSHYLPIYIIV